MSSNKVLAEYNKDTCRETAYLGDIAKSGIVSNSGLGDGRLRPCAE